MTLDYQAGRRASKGALWTGRVISALPVLMMALSAAMKFAKPPDAVKGFEHLGWSEQMAVGLAVVELACALIYVIPQTAVLGAILVTGYLGGAAATHVRLGDVQAAIPIVLGVLAWVGLALREPRLWALIPIRR